MWKYLILASIVLGLLLTGCKKDEDDDNNTPLPPPDNLYLDSLIIEAMPFTDESGAGWDLSSGPDLFCRLLQGSTVISTTGQLVDLNPSSLPTGWFASTPYLIDVWTTDVVVDLWDYDDISDDYIGNVVFDFESQALQYGYINHYTASNATQTITARIACHWE